MKIAEALQALNDEQDLDHKYNCAKSLIYQMPKEIDEPLTEEQQKEVYAYFKQAEVGDINRPKPSFYQFTEVAKWNSWNELKGTSQKDAKQIYAAKVYALLKDRVDYLPGDFNLPINPNAVKLNADPKKFYTVKF